MSDRAFVGIKMQVAAHGLTALLASSGGAVASVKFLESQLAVERDRNDEQERRLAVLEDTTERSDKDAIYRAERLALMESRVNAQGARDTEALRTLNEINVKISRIEGKMEERERQEGRRP